MEEKPTSTSHVLKRKQSESSDSSVELTGPSFPAKALKNEPENESGSGMSLVETTDSEGSSCTTETSTPSISMSPVQDCTSQWTEDTLNRLQITSDTQTRFSASEILERIPVKSSSSAVDVMVNRCIELLDINSSPLKYLDVNDIGDIDISLAYSLMYLKPETTMGLRKRQIRSWIAGTGKNDCYGYENWFCQMFYVHGHRFTQQLINMCLYQQSEQLREVMFESLFQEFAGMFGLLSMGQKLLSGTKAKLGNTQVTSVPDIIFPDFTESNEDKMKVLAVCEVKREFKEKELTSPKETRSQKRTNSKKSKYKTHLDEDVLGQHGGELLLHLPLTERRSLLGIVVQRTNVTFSHFTCTEVQLKKIFEGKTSQGLEIVYSRPYNFLKADDRKELIKAILTLGVIQITPYV